MSKFSEKKAEILKAGEPKDGGTRKCTFNSQQFNELATALMNDPDYEDVVMVRRGGELQEVATTPVADLRKSMIGGPLKAAGVDNADAAKIVGEYQYSTLPIYPVVSVLMEGYLEAGKAFSFERRKDLDVSLRMETKAEETKTSKTPNGDGATTTSIYGEHRVIKSKAKCPVNLKKRIK